MKTPAFEIVANSSERQVKVAAGKVGVPARVALKDPGVSLAHLSKFGSGLNMKSVEIDLTQVNQQTPSDEPTIDIKMFVEQQGREVIFRQLVPTDKRLKKDSFASLSAAQLALQINRG